MTSKLAPSPGAQEELGEELADELLADLAIDTLMDLLVTRALDRQLRRLTASPPTRLPPRGAQKKQDGGTQDGGT